MALNTIRGMKLNDGTTEFDVSALSNEALKKISISTAVSGDPTPDPSAESKNQLTLGSNFLPADGTYGLKNTDVRARKAVRLWPGRDNEDDEEASCSEIDLMGDGAFYAGVATSDIKQVHVKAMLSKEISKTNKNKTLRLKQSCSELELNNKNATGVKNETAEQAGDFSIKAKYDNDFQNLNVKARAIDIRTNTTGVVGGSGGGIALQIASCDSNFKENKLKLETARKVDVFEGLPSSAADVVNYYNTTDTKTFEGGSGIEIGTFNSQFESMGTKEIRRLANSSVYAVTRGAIAEDSSTHKFDYPTQSDDSKDIKEATQPFITWLDLINAAAYLKLNGSIPSDGSFYTTAGTKVSVENRLKNVTTSNSNTATSKTEEYTATLTAAAGKTIPANGVTVFSGNTDITSTAWNAGLCTITIPTASLTANIVITATAS